MYQDILHQIDIFPTRLKSIQILRRVLVCICISFVVMQYLCIKLFTWQELPAPVQTRLHSDLPVTINLQPYSVCHPKEFDIENLTIHYHQAYPNKEQQACFLVEDLNGGAWWSYVSQEFAEILTHLEVLALQSNITYRSFPPETELNYKTNLKKYFLNACELDENLPQEKQIPIIILLWNINRVLWYYVRHQWYDLLKTTRIRLIVFIDDLHFTASEIFNSRQFLFESVASEILSTYAYLFHNYYHDIPSQKITWLPHSASTLSYRSINRTAENLLFISGANLFDWYPCRWRAFFLCRRRSDLVACLKHPGYAEGMKNDSSFYYGGRRYFSYMRQYVFGLGTCQSVHYAIGKLFEIPANGLVLVTTDDLIPILAKLHLHLNEHYVNIDCSTSKYLTNEIIRLKNISTDDLFQMRQKSQEIIIERHLTSHRAELLHVRLLSQALIASTASAKQRTQWEQWGRNCQEPSP